MSNPKFLSYESYQVIKSELHEAIDEKGLDIVILKRLYESKLRYLEQLRVNCFREINLNPETSFTPSDLGFIIAGIKITGDHIESLVKNIIGGNRGRSELK